MTFYLCLCLFVVALVITATLTHYWKHDTSWRAVICTALAWSITYGLLTAMVYISGSRGWPIWCLAASVMLTPLAILIETRRRRRKRERGDGG